MVQLNRKLAVRLLLFLVIILPAAYVFVKEEELTDDVDELAEWMGEDYVPVHEQLRDYKCPAPRAGQNLEDYWRCLFGTSITAAGWRTHEHMEWEREKLYEEAMAEAKTEFYKALARAQRGDNINVTILVRTKRQTSGRENYEKAEEYLQDVMAGRILDQKHFMECEQNVNPASSIYEFLYCVRNSKHIKATQTDDGEILPPQFGFSFNARFQTTTLPPFESVYDKDEYTLITVPATDDSGKKRSVTLRFDFTMMTDEEHSSVFFGADPYLVENESPYRYKYDNGLRQNQPAWSYSGLFPAKQWHQLDTDRFLIPLKASTNLKNLSLTPELAQIYPALGTLTQFISSIGAPIEHGWTKDKGKFAYTRFLPPLITASDLEYYKAKGLVAHDLEVKTILETLETIIQALAQVKKGEEEERKEFNTAMEDFPGQVRPDRRPLYEKAYLDFIEHFWQVPIGPLRKETWDAWNEETPDHGYPYEEILDHFVKHSRFLLHAYMDVARVQLACLKAMIQDSEREVDNEEEIEALIEQAKMDDECHITHDAEEAVSERCVLNGKYVDCFEENDKIVVVDGEEYRVHDVRPVINVSYFITEQSLKVLYDQFWERRKARQRYSLPVFPKAYPICQHNNPSPLDIVTSRARESTLRDYIFGDAAYMLNRFFMFFPLDGSPLLTLGIANGQRLDDSSVKLTGGAVRGHSLAFQYMHIHYAKDWQGLGSEHQINGKGAPMELQLVFTISGSADQLKYWHILARVQNQLFQFRDQLVIIISVLVDVEATDKDVEARIEKEKLNQDPYLFEPLAQAAYHFSSIPRRFSNYQSPRGYVSLDPVIRLIEFIPRVTSNYYTYRGSLTWPPCFAYVIWSVFEKRLVMSKRQFDQFVKIPAYGVNDDQYVAGNRRAFDDIWVEEEKRPDLNYYNIQALERRRIEDRPILGGLQRVEEDGTDGDKEDAPIVIPEVYDWEGPINYRQKNNADTTLALVSPFIVSFMLALLQLLMFHFLL